MTPHSQRRTSFRVTAMVGSAVILALALGYHGLTREPSRSPVALSGAQPAAAVESDHFSLEKKPVTPAPGATSAPDTDDQPSLAGEQPFWEQEVKARLIQVRDQFAEDAQFPAYARPIRSAEELAKYQPNRAFETATPTDFEDPSAPSLSLVLTQQRYAEDEPVVAMATINGLDASADSRVTARIVANRRVLAQASGVAESGEPARRYRVTFDRLDALRESGASDLVLIAEFAIDGDRFEVSAPFSVVNTVAIVDEVGRAEVVGEHLKIPVSITVAEAGLHKLTANLYDAKSGQPVVHLSSRGELPDPGGVIMLKAHIASLKVMGREGPYLLGDIALQRLPSAPRFLTEYGRALQETYPVDGFPFRDYQDVPYQDEKIQSRLEFLTQIGGDTQR